MDISTPAHRFHQGGRVVYAFSLDLTTLNTLLPDRVDDRIVKGANRQLTASHAKKIQIYLEERDDWLLGALMLGIAPNAVEFLPYQANSDDAPLTVGELRINTDRQDAMKMFDGQHRRRAIKDTLSQLKSNKQGQARLKSLQGDSVPIMLYVVEEGEEGTKALRQMFVDAAQTKTIERNTVARFDLRNAFNLAALELEKSSGGLFSGRVEMELASVSQSSQHLIAINQLAATLKILIVGHRGRVSKDTNDKYMLNLEDLHERCSVWADDFMPFAREEYEGLMAGEIDNSEIPRLRSETLAYNVPIIGILAGCYYEWAKDDTDWRPLAKFLRGASLKPKSGEGALLVNAGAVAPGGITPHPSRQVATSAIEYIVRRAKEFNNERKLSR